MKLRLRKRFRRLLGRLLGGRLAGQWGKLLNYPPLTVALQGYRPETNSRNPPNVSVIYGLYGPRIPFIDCFPPTGIDCEFLHATEEPSTGSEDSWTLSLLRRLLAIPDKRRAYMHSQLAYRARAPFFLFLRQPSDWNETWLASTIDRLGTETDIGVCGDPNSKAFLVRAEIWRALAGYSSKVPKRGPWQDIEFDQRVRGLGFRVLNRKNFAELSDSQKAEASSPKFLHFRTTLQLVPERMWSPCLPSLPLKAVLYTAVAGGYDELKAVPERCRRGVDCIAYLDAASQAIVDSQVARSWRLRALDEDSDTHPNRKAKIYKVLPHRFFPQHEYSLWVDASIELVLPYSVEDLARIFLRDHDLCVFRHGKRNCIYDEASACIEKGLDDPATILAQVQRYRQAGYPERDGLIEAPVLLRRHTPALEQLNEHWWQEICAGSMRDQISFNVVARKLGFRYATFPLDLSRPNGLFVKRPHRLGAPSIPSPAANF